MPETQEETTGAEQQGLVELGLRTASKAWKEGDYDGAFVIWLWLGLFLACLAFVLIGLPIIVVLSS